MTNGPGEMQNSSETVKMETSSCRNMDDTAHLKIDEDLMMDKNDFSSLLSSTSGSATDLHHIYQMIHGGADGSRSAAEAAHHIHQPHDQFSSPSARFSTTGGAVYRDNPAIDEATSMPFSGTMALHGEMSMLGDEATTFMAASSHHSPTRPANSEYDAATISTLLGPFEKINPADDQFNEGTTYNRSVDYGESPRKMSRVGSADVTVDKLFNNDENQHAAKDGFQFRKFGMEINQRTSPENNQNSIYSPAASHCMRTDSHSHDGLLSQPTAPPSLHSLSHPAVSNIDPPKAPYREPVDHSQISPNHYSVPPSLRNNRRNLIHNSPPLTQSFPDRHGNIILKILKQPEAQHRARYMTEGSRGAVKDSQQQGHPVVQLLGWDDDARLEIFIGADSGKVKPHGFYQACRISGKNASVSREREVDGTVVIEMEFDKSKQMTATVNIPQNDGGILTLQTVSTVIACTQPAGQPEVCRMSLHMSPMVGGQSLFVIGKNFVKGFRVKFQELKKGTEEVIWEQEADVDHEFTHATHFICTVPSYKNEYSYGVVNAQVIVEACGGTCEPVHFQYHPDQKESLVSSATSPMSSSNSLTTNADSSSGSSMNNNTPMSSAAATPASNHESPRSFVSPEALELVAQLQQQQSSQNSNKMFQIPDGVDFISQESNHSQRNSNFVSEVKPIGIPNHYGGQSMSGSLLDYSNSSNHNGNEGNSLGGNDSSNYICHQ